MNNTENDDGYFYWIITAFPELRRTHLETGAVYCWHQGEWREDPSYLDNSFDRWRTARKVTKEEAILFVLFNGKYVP